MLFYWEECRREFFLTKYDPDTKTTGHTQNKWVQLSMDSKSAFSCLMEIHIFITTTIKKIEIFSYNVAENCFFFFKTVGLLEIICKGTFQSAAVQKLEEIDVIQTDFL